LAIRILPDEVASAIAAGEVVERPESVVKELIENAIDAAAKRIQITIEQGGKKLIEVIDDGVGIPAQDVPLAIARHATSKLSSTEDLYKIQTLGFRGEALSSMGAVSHLEILTHFSGENLGTRLSVSGGKISPPTAIGAPIGTTVRVRDLFFNIPVRLKFLKSEATERRRIRALVSRYALAYSKVSFTLMQGSRKSLQTTGNGDRREILASMFGVEVAKSMITLPDPIKSPIRVTGFISPPAVHRGSRRGITLFVQGRWIQDPSLSAAVLQAYHGLLMVGRFPLATVLIDLPPEDVDVNVHPAKGEVRFKEPNKIFTVVQRTIRATLLHQVQPPELEINRAWNLKDTPQPQTVSHAEDSKVEPINPQRIIPNFEVPILRSVGQVGAAYLVAEGPDGIYLIDQHAAHERVLFEALMQRWKAGEIESQHLLAPLNIDLNHDEAALLNEQLAAVQSLGFDIEHFGGDSFRLRAVPAILSNSDPQETLRTVVEDFEEDEGEFAAEVEARLAARVCKRAAIKSGQILSLQEQRQLLSDLEHCESPRTCPHGRPTMIYLSVDVLERQFGRRG